MAESKRFTLNKQDVQKWLWDCFIFLIPTILFLISQIQDTLPQAHLPVWVLPIASYFLAQLTALIKRYAKGK